MYESVFESAALNTIAEAVNYRRTSRRSSLLFFSQARKHAFKKLASCIAKVSNIYVVSPVSWYILTSSFMYENVVQFYDPIESSLIEIISYGYTDMGSVAQTLSDKAVEKALGYSLVELRAMNKTGTSMKNEKTPDSVSPKDITKVEQA
ncbi:hypothetical protein ABG067_005636 [Albugo candida]